MEIKLNTNNDLAARAVQRETNTTPASPARDHAAFENLTTLGSKLDSIPVVRPDAVTRAQILINAADYPPEKTMKGLATLLAVHLRDQSQEPK